ncbi:UNVERIFIED_ORG: hypothetical protein M2414_003331 [Rahnella aquatilis]
MTDTTDIAALRKRLQSAISQHEMMMGCVMGLSRVDPMYQQCLDALNDLEAERQRAADLVLHVNTQANMREKAEKERDGVVKNYNRVTDERNSALYEVAALKAKLANPVVHPTRAAGHSYASVAISARDEQWFTAINEAGFTVKGE